MMTGSLPTILVADDNPGDRELVRLTLSDLNIRAHCVDVTNGSDCLAYLRREGEYANAVRPKLIVLDNTMPRLTGAQVLRELNNDAELKSIPVLHWSSAASREVGSAFRARACARKPLDFDEYRSAIQTVCGLLPAR